MAIDTASAPRLSVEEISRFLFEEAAMLDDNRLSDWLNVLTRDVDYRIPVRIVRERGGGTGISERAFLMREDYDTLRTRILRLDSEFAWSENPPTRTRRMVANVRRGAPLPSVERQEVLVLSNIAVFCFKGDATTPVILTGERQDTLRREDDGWKLARRIVLLDSTVLGLQALSIFL